MAPAHGEILEKFGISIIIFKYTKIIVLLIRHRDEKQSFYKWIKSFMGVTNLILKGGSSFQKTMLEKV